MAARQDNVSDGNVQDPKKDESESLNIHCTDSKFLNQNNAIHQHIHYHGNQLPETSNVTHVQPVGEKITENLIPRFSETLKKIVLNTMSYFALPGSTKLLDLNSVFINLSLKKSPTQRVLGAEAIIQNVKQLFSESTKSEERVEQVEMEGEKEEDEEEEEDEEDEEDDENQKEEDEEEKEVETKPVDSEDEENSEQMPFDGMVDIIETFIKQNITNRILINAAGGTGKTTLSKKLMLQWAKKECLKDFKAIIRLDMKNIDYDQDVVGNLLIQYPGLKSFINENNRSAFEEQLSQQPNILWMLDSLDESNSIRKAKNFVSECQKQFFQSPFFLLTRPEGIEIICSESQDSLEFGINKLNIDDLEELVKVFPISKDAEMKRKEFIIECKKNPIFRKCMSLPIHAVSYCALLNDESTPNIKTTSDVLIGLTGLATKSSALKVLDKQLEKARTDEQKEEIENEKNKISKKPSKQILIEKEHVLQALGRAVFVCNGNSIAGNKDLDEDLLKSELEKNEKLEENDVELALRLNLMEKITIEEGNGEKSFYRFFHRNLRELIVSFFLCDNNEPLDLPEKREAMSDALLSVLRCTIYNLQQKCSGDVDCLAERLGSVVEHIIKSCDEIGIWRCTQIVCELIQLSLNIKTQSFKIDDLIFKSLDILAERCPFAKKLQKIITTDFLKILNYHYQSQRCTECKPSKAFAKYFSKCKESTNLTEIYNWPDKMVFKVYPLLINKVDIVIIAIVDAYHLNESSKPIIVRAPIFKDPLLFPPTSSAMTLIPNYSASNPEASFPGASDVVVVNLDDQIHVLSGRGEDGRLLRPKLVWRLHPPSNTWSKDETEGDVPPWLFGAAGLVVHLLLYLFGGFDKNRYRNEIYTYQSSSRRWKRIRCQGPTPSRRAGMCSWTDGRDCFFFGGLCDEPSASNLKGGEGAFFGCTNQLVRFSPSTKRWADVDTKGRRPKPRYGAGCAAVKAKAYVLGGIGISYGNFNDLWCFDMKSSSWTEIVVISAPKPLPYQCPNLIAVSQHQILLVGGGSKGETWLFDLETKKWSKGDDLPAQEGETRFWNHGAALVGGSVFVVGGDRRERIINSIFSSHVIKIRLWD